ncbi:hypothetical protein FOZ63_025898, partial [Perkinsus olseni]
VSPRAKSLVEHLRSQHGARFANITDAAGRGEFEIFKALVDSLLSSIGEPRLLPVILKALYNALGNASFQQSWRAAAKRLCNLLSEATENGVPIGRPFEGSLKSLAKDLDDLDECRSPQSFNEFRERMRVLLSVPPNCPPSFVEYSVECSRRCRRLVDNFCEVLEPLLH